VPKLIIAPIPGPNIAKPASKNNLSHTNSEGSIDLPPIRGMSN